MRYTTTNSCRTPRNEFLERFSVLGMHEWSPRCSRKQAKDNNYPTSFAIVFFVPKKIQNVVRYTIITNRYERISKKLKQYLIKLTDKRNIKKEECVLYYMDLGS